MHLPSDVDDMADLDDIDIPDEPLLTVVEVAHALRVSKMTIYRLVHAGEIPYVIIGKSFRVKRTALLNYIKSL
jgi:excisionase family DNA binding protein